MLLAETFRNLQRLNRDLNDINVPFAAATSGASIASFAPGYCPGDGSGGPTGAEVTEFQDNDLSSNFSSGDTIIFSYGNTNCILSADVDFASEPNQVGGYARFTFDASSVVPNVGAGNRTFSGSVEFLNYIYLNGVLAHIDQDQDTILSGTVNFNVTFDNSVDNSGNGASTAAFSSATAIAFDGRSAGPLTVQFAANGATPAIERNVASNRDTVVTIRDLVVTFESDLTLSLIHI